MNSPFRNPPRAGERFGDLSNQLNDLGRDTGRAVDTARHSSGIAGLRGRLLPMFEDVGEWWHPFKVYLSASGNDDAETLNGWRKHIVRAGRVGVSEVTYTDAVTDPYSSERGATAATGEIIVPAGEAAYPIWIQYLPESPLAEILHGDEAARVELWPGYPGPCTTEGYICLLVAIVDTLTNQANNGPALVRQIRVADETDWFQACVNEAGVDRVRNVPSEGGSFDFVVATAASIVTGPEGSSVIGPEGSVIT